MFHERRKAAQRFCLVCHDAPIFAAPQTVETPVIIPVSGVDFSLIEAALGAFGIGLVGKVPDEILKEGKK